MEPQTKKLVFLFVGALLVLVISLSVASSDKQQAQLISGIASSALYNEFLQDDNRSPNFTQVAANKVTARKYLRVKEGAQFCFGYMCFQSVCNNGSGLFYLCGATDIRHKQDQGQSGGGQGTVVLPTSCIDQPETKAVITSLSRYSGPVGTKLEIRGCNFAGFEGDKNVWIENSQGVKGILYGEQGSTAKVIKITLKSPLCSQDNSYSGLPCSSYLTLIPGAYKIWIMPWGENTKSNPVTFTIK